MHAVAFFSCTCLCNSNRKFYPFIVLLLQCFLYNVTMCTTACIFWEKNVLLHLERGWAYFPGWAYFEEIAVYTYISKQKLYFNHTVTACRCALCTYQFLGDGWMGSNSKGRDNKLMIYTTLWMVTLFIYQSTYILMMWETRREKEVYKCYGFHIHVTFKQ